MCVANGATQYMYIHVICIANYKNRIVNWDATPLNLSIGTCRCNLVCRYPTSMGTPHIHGHNPHPWAYPISMGISHIHGHTPYLWAYPTSMGIPHIHGHTPHPWAYPTSMGISHIHGHIPYPWAHPTSMGISHIHGHTPHPWAYIILTLWHTKTFNQYNQCQHSCLLQTRKNNYLRDHMTTSAHMLT